MDAAQGEDEGNTAAAAAPGAGAHPEGDDDGPDLDSELFSRWAVDVDEKQESRSFFDPCKGNVVFASAYDGWAFGMHDFVEPVAAKTGLAPNLLRNTLWGDFALKMPEAGGKSKRIGSSKPKAHAKSSVKSESSKSKRRGESGAKSKSKGSSGPSPAAASNGDAGPEDGSASTESGTGAAQSDYGGAKVVQIKRRQAVAIGGAAAHGYSADSGHRGGSAAGGSSKQQSRRPMAAELVLDSIWRAYRYCKTDPNPKKASKLVKQFGIEMSEAELDAKDPAGRLRALMRAWLPLPRAVMRAVARQLPSPAEAAPLRMERIMPDVPQTMNPRLRRHIERVRAAIVACDSSDDAPCVAFVTKMVAVPAGQVPAAASSVAGPRTEDEEGKADSLGLRGFPGSDLVGLERQIIRYQGDEAASAWGGGRDASKCTSITTQIFARGASDVPLTPPRSSDTAASRAATGEHEEEEEEEVFLGFARVFSGVLRPDRPVFVLGPKYRPERAFREEGQHVS